MGALLAEVPPFDQPESSIAAIDQQAANIRGDLEQWPSCRPRFCSGNGPASSASGESVKFHLTMPGLLVLRVFDGLRSRGQLTAAARAPDLPASTGVHSTCGFARFRAAGDQPSVLAQDAAVGLTLPPCKNRTGILATSIQLSAAE